jgi:23S rRNA (pseudouridine1915-N3)-methyltransferase
MLKITILAYGTIKESYLREAITEYSKRISPYFAFEIFETKGEGTEDAARIAAKLREDHRAYKIALCIEGEQRTSEEFSELLSKKQSTGYSHIILLIGPSDGLTEAEKAACDLRLSFSKATFPHQLMRVILLEQIYRAGNILGGGRYHK